MEVCYARISTESNVFFIYSVHHFCINPELLRIQGLEIHTLYPFSFRNISHLSMSAELLTFPEK